MAAAYTTVGAAFRDYLQIMSEPASFAVGDLVDFEGRVYAEKCPRCKGTRFVVQDGVQRCSGFRCGKPRPYENMAVPRRFFRAPDRHSPEYLDRAAALGLAFKELTLWEKRVLTVYVHLPAEYGRNRTGAWEWVLSTCWEAWPRKGCAGGTAWTLDEVKRLQRSAMEKGERGCIRQKILEP